MRGREVHSPMEVHVGLGVGQKGHPLHKSCNALPAARRIVVGMG